jgi:hypothetical protein
MVKGAYILHTLQDCMQALRNHGRQQRRAPPSAQNAQLLKAKNTLKLIQGGVTAMPGTNPLAGDTTPTLSRMQGHQPVRSVFISSKILT